MSHTFAFSSTSLHGLFTFQFIRLQNSPYFCVFKYARAVKQKVWNEAENREQDWACDARAVRAHKTLTPRVTDFFTDFEEKTDCFAVYQFIGQK